jgi:hypothetical protein
MKKKSLNKKLVFNKKTITNLNNEKLQSVKGGEVATFDCQISFDFGVCISINVACITQEP